MGEEEDLPGILGRAAQAKKEGGWDALADKEAKEAIESLKEIKKEQWTAINANLMILRDFAKMDVMEFMETNLMESIKLQFQESLSPILNDLTALSNIVIQEIMPFVDKMIEVVLPLVQWIADTLKVFIDYFTTGPGATAEEARADFMSWAIQWRLAHPFASPYEMMLAFLQYVADTYGTAPPTDDHTNFIIDDNGTVIM